ncbi:hypothetical protein VTH8203_02458 [Vibrio thalassae]|uniref:Uncharacterized protein n=1 Tax=Vibrio thalassae TaxID=1243014 RepID=A0A240EJY3_9VIBR|nr:hypothetical protein [Vibrio thalassae]SNX48821.1 hypothetical protein VTH8203_02458 [Vibrio thalassae]
MSNKIDDLVQVAELALQAKCLDAVLNINNQYVGQDINEQDYIEYNEVLTGIWAEIIELAQAVFCQSKSVYIAINKEVLASCSTLFREVWVGAISDLTRKLIA